MNKNSIPTHNPVGKESESNALTHLWKSPWTSWVGFRYLKSKKNSRFLSFITLLSIMGVGLGVTAMIVVLSVMDGFESELKKRMMSSELHILVQPTQKITSFDRGFVAADALTPALVQTFLNDREHPIVSFEPVVSTEAILKTGRKVSGIVFKGVTDERLTRLKSQMVESTDPQQLVIRNSGTAGLSEGGSTEGKPTEGKPTEGKEESSKQLPGIFLGQELAYEMGLIPGDQVTLISPTEFEGPVDGIPRLKRYAVEGVYHSGMPEQELHTVFARKAAVYSFLRKSDVVSQWEISVKDFSQAPGIASRIRTLAPQFRVQDWVQMNSHLFASLRLERLSMFVILAFIIIVASFNIVTTLTLMVLEKKKEISILKAMGARNSQVAAIFLAEGALIGAVGVAGGLLLGFMICMGLKRYEFITLPDIYYDRTLPVTFDLKYYVIVSCCALVIVLGACLYPSRRAAQLDPLEGIRFG